MRPGVAEMMVGSQDDAGGAAGIDHVPRLTDREGEWLFAQDMLAGAGGAQDLVMMQLVGGRDVDRIDLAEQRIQIGRGMRDAVRFRVGRGAILIAAHHGDDVAARRADRIDHPFPCDRTRSSSPQRSVVVMRSSFPSVAGSNSRGRPGEPRRCTFPASGCRMRSGAAASARRARRGLPRRPRSW